MQCRMTGRKRGDGPAGNAAAGGSPLWRLALVALALALSPCVAPAGAQEAAGRQDSAWARAITSRMDSLLRWDMFTTSTVGMMVWDLTADSALFMRNERLLLRPASTMKILTAVTALDALGADHRMATVLYRTGEVAGGVLEGDLYCKGGFDPMFGTGDLAILVDKVRELGIDTIRGSIFSDVTAKDADRLGEGWCWDDDNPVLSPLLLSRRDDFALGFLEALRAAGIHLDGHLAWGPVPSGARAVAFLSRTVGDLLPRMMKRSDNLVAEAVFYHLSGSEPYTARRSRKAVNRLITGMGLNPEKYYVADGSGLSLYNYVSAELEVGFLRYAYLHPDIYGALYAALPVAGTDGTLEGRMQGGHTLGNVRAKTGTLTKISALAGYLRAGNGHLLCFSIINNGVDRSSLGQRFQDAVCEELCRPVARPPVN